MGVGYKNVSSKLYPTLKHEILNEKENQIIYEDIYEFIKNARINPWHFRYKKTRACE